MKIPFIAVATALTAFNAAGAFAASSRLPATGGVTQIEGAAGGGLVPWAVIAGVGSRDEIGGSTWCTQVEPSDFRLTGCGIGVGVLDRAEVSYARQRFGLGTTVPGESIDQDIVGLKVRLFGDAVFDQDTWLPQIAVGIQYKKNRDFAIPELIGARDDHGIDYYLAATKVWLAGPFGRSVLANATLRATRANQLGILGFGGDRNDDYTWQPELSLGVFLTDDLIVGAEYRNKPDNLSAFDEEAFADLFAAWVPSKHLSMTAAYVDLGNIADKDSQRGWYLSLQGSF